MLAGALRRTQPGQRRVPFPRRGTATVAIAVTYGTARYLAAAGAAALTGSSIGLDPVGEVTAALLVGVILAWLAARVVGTSTRRTAALALLLFTGVAAVMLEGSAFAPSLSPLDRLPTGLAMQAGVSLVTASTAVAALAGPSTSVGALRRGVLASTARLIGAGLIYVAAYFATGAISYELVTGPYYAAHAGGLVTPPPATVLAVALGEGLLIAAGAIPVVRSWTSPRRAVALGCGITLWVLGGLVPLLQEASLPDVIRAASVIEIFFQKVPLGIAVTWLFWPRPSALSAATPGVKGPRS